MTIQILATLSYLFLSLVGFYIIFRENLFQKNGKQCLLWISIFLIFVCTIRILLAFNFLNSPQAIIVTGFTGYIPLAGLLFNLFLNKESDKGVRK